MAARKRKGQSRADKIIAFAHAYLRVPEGKDAGKPLKLRKFHQDWIRAIYDSPRRIRRAIISVGRKNAKTT